jgi:hypothetical protein
VACGGRGWLGERKMSLVPKELLPPGSAMAEGRPVKIDPPVPVANWRDSELPEEEWKFPPEANLMVVVPVRVTDEETGETVDANGLMSLNTMRPVAAYYIDNDSAPLDDLGPSFSDGPEDDGGVW